MKFTWSPVVLVACLSEIFIKQSNVEITTAVSFLCVLIYMLKATARSAAYFTHVGLGFSLFTIQMPSIT